MNVATKSEVRNFTYSWDNRGYLRKILGCPCIRPRSLFSKMFNGLLFGYTVRIHWPNLKSVALPIPEIIALEILGGVANPNLGEEEAVRGRGWYRSKEHW